MTQTDRNPARMARVEDNRLVRGLGQYVADPQPDRMAHGHFLRSPHASARIRSLDVSAARAMRGVIGILTAEDMEKANVRNITVHPPVAGRNGTKLHVPQRPCLARDRVRHIGEPIALIVAETKAIALDAAEAIVVDYEPLRAVVEAGAALAPGAPQVWDDVAGNLALDWAGHEGNTPDNVAEVERAFAAATHVARLRIPNQRIAAVTMEPRGATASFDDGVYTIRVGTQGAGAMLGVLTQAMGTDRIRVLNDEVGGGFGLKAGNYPEYPALMVASKQFARPVHWMATRSEAFTSDNEARDGFVDAELAFDAAQKITALRLRVTANLGAYLAPPGALIYTANLVRCLPGMYHIPKIDVQARSAFTNTVPIGPYRGAGRPEANYILERLMDHAARGMKVDPARLRRKNIIPDRAIPYRTAVGTVFDSGRFRELFDLALEKADYAGFARRRRESARRGLLRGLGMSCFVEHAGATPLDSASIVFPDDGSLIVGIGLQSSGQGHATVFANLVAERLALQSGDVRVVYGDSDMKLKGGAAVGSRAAMTVGSAILRTVEIVLDKGRQVAGHMLEAAKDDIEYADGTFRIAGTDRKVTLREVAREAKALKARGTIAETLDTTASAEAPITWPNGCHIAEVEIDPETGKLALVAYTAVDDCGNILHEAIVAGQVQGGIAQGLGQVLMEHVVYDNDGQNLTASFMDYAMPRAADIPSMQSHYFPVPTKTNPLGVKGVGEAGTTGSLGAAMNAIHNALPEGGPAVEMPVTSETIWRALR